MSRNIAHLTLTAIGFGLLVTALSQPAQAEDYWRTYSYTRTFTAPVESTFTTQRVIETPALIDRVIDEPAVIDRVIEKPVPVMIDRIVEKPVIIEKVVEKPVMIDRVIEKPVIVKERTHHNLLHLGLPFLNVGLF